MNEVKIDQLERQLPSEWNELTRKQLLQVAELFQKKISVLEFKVQALFHLLSAKRKFFKKIHPEDAHGLCKSLNFLLKEVSLTKNLLTVIRIGWRKYYGPSDAMLNCTFGEFTVASSILDLYYQTKDENHLSDLAAVLFRPKKKLWLIRRKFSDDQDSREPFKEWKLKRRQKKFEKIDPCIRYSIFLFFSGVLNSLPQLYPYVYQQKENSEGENGWSSLIISLADGKTDDKSLETIMSSNLYNVFIGLNKKAKEYNEYLSKIESHGKY